MPTTISGDTGCSQVQAGSIQFDDVSAGMMIGSANYTTGAYASGTTTIPWDDTIPQITEGDQYMSLSYTAKKANSKLRIDVIGNFVCSAVTNFAMNLYKDSGADAIGTSYTYIDAANNQRCIPLTVYINAVDTSPHTFTIRAGGNSAGTNNFNGGGNTRRYGGSLASSITITEIAQ